MGTTGRAGVALLLLAAPLGADEVHLRSGGVVRGVIVEQTAQGVVVETGPGRVSLPMARVARIEKTETALATFQERAADVSPDDVEGLARLARYAGDHDLSTLARETWQRVLTLDPGHPEANEALGRSYLDGAWMSERDAYRTQGYVQFRGRWVTPEEHDALVREDLAREQAATDRREAQARLRTAEARAREAEARAREAEVLADQAENPVEGIPYWWVLNGGGPIWGPGYPRPPRKGPGSSGNQPHPGSQRAPWAVIQGDPSRPGPTGTINSGRSGHSGRRH